MVEKSLMYDILFLATIADLSYSVFVPRNNKIESAYLLSKKCIILLQKRRKFCLITCFLFVLEFF